MFGIETQDPQDPIEKNSSPPKPRHKVGTHPRTSEPIPKTERTTAWLAQHRKGNHKGNPPTDLQDNVNWITTRNCIPDA